MFESIWTKYLIDQNLEDRKICPVCGYVGRFDIPESGKTAAATICPQCGSRERDRLYWMYLLRENILFERNRVVQVNPDVAIKSKIREYPRVKYRSVGFRDLENIQDEGVDLFMANYVLDRVDDLEACLEAMRHCLSEKGRIMASMFFAKDPSDPKRYTPEGFVEKLEELGFEVTVMNGDDLCGSFLANVCGIRPKDLVVIAEPKG
ncbi:MAG: hypothetical protein IKR86_06900 [Candidatus Methanomethylophilaceae archaeon]|nr:hypothetical protein [Candidatus Methanomethylophilaceae archaeon]MBR6038000.1 hypothetical protein [Candidatus Methanomethylophilaceae archaeon]